MRARIRVASLICLAAVVAGCGQNKFEKEVEPEATAVKLTRETVSGEYELISTEELKVLLDEKKDFVLIDAMPFDESFAKAHIPGAENIVFPKDVVSTDEWKNSETGGKSQSDYEALLGEDKDKLVVVYCGFTKCARSHNAAVWAIKLGYSNVKRYPGGIYAWKGAGHATESGG